MRNHNTSVTDGQVTEDRQQPYHNSTVTLVRSAKSAITLT